MGGKFDEVKGRIKEAAGALTDNDKLREEGQVDQVGGRIEQAIDHASAGVKRAAEAAADKARLAAQTL